MSFLLSTVQLLQAGAGTIDNVFTQRTVVTRVRVYRRPLALLTPHAVPL